MSTLHSGENRIKTTRNSTRRFPEGLALGCPEAMAAGHTGLEAFNKGTRCETTGGEGLVQEAAEATALVPVPFPAS